MLVGWRWLAYGVLVAVWVGNSGRSVAQMLVYWFAGVCLGLRLYAAICGTKKK